MTFFDVLSKFHQKRGAAAFGGKFQVKLKFQANAAAPFSFFSH